VAGAIPARPHRAAGIRAAGPAGMPAVGAAPARVCPAPAAPAGVPLLHGDIDGDGCPGTATWANGVLTVWAAGAASPTRFAIGEPGDVVLLGDWTGSGLATPAVYRPTTGMVYEFISWAPKTGSVGPAITWDSGRPNGVATVQLGKDGRDHVAVAPRPPAP